MQAVLFKMLVAGGFASIALIAALVLRRQLDGLDAFVRRTPKWQRAFLGLFLGVFIAFGGTKNSATNNGEATSSSLATNLTSTSIFDGPRSLFLTSDEDVASPLPCLTVTSSDVARGWRLWEVRTNAAVNYAMPEGAALATNWWVHGAYEDVRREGLGKLWAFPLGSNEYDSVWAYTWGKIRPRLRDASNEIAAVGAPMAAVPGLSRFWTAPTTNSYLLTWEDFTLGRVGKEEVVSLQAAGTPLPLVSAQVELFATGDFITRSNEVERVYHRIDDFDWDGDGIVNAEDADPYGYDGDFCGQPPWWRAYVDETVGVGLENGYYRLLARVPSDGFKRAVLTVGSEKVVVAEPGEYVFLLEKGMDYEFAVTPFNPDVEFEVADDLPIVPSLMMLGGGHWTPWTIDGGRLLLTTPTFDRVGSCCWLPTFQVTPGMSHLGPGDSPQTFTAVLSDYAYCQSVAYSWSSSDANVVIYSPQSEETNIGVCHMPSWASASVSVTASFGNHTLESQCAFSYGEHHQPEVVLGLVVPPALLLNSNRVDAAKTGQIYVSFSPDIPTNGTLSLSCVSGSGRVSLSGDCSWRVTDCDSHTVDVTGNKTSEALGDVVFQLTFTPDQGNSVSASSPLTVVQVNNVSLPGAPSDGLVISTGTSVALDVDVLPASANGLLSTVFNVRRLRADGTYTDWTYAAGNYGGTDAIYNPPTGGIYQVQALVGVGWGAEDERYYVWDEDEDLSIGPGRNGRQKAFGVCDEEWQKTLRNCAKAFLGSTAYLEKACLPAEYGFAMYLPYTYKCNVFVAHRARQSGLVFPALHGRILDRCPPTANELANASIMIESWPPITGSDYPQPGYVAATPGSQSGHCGIVDFDGWGISAGQNNVNRWMGAVSSQSLLRTYEEDENE